MKQEILSIRKDAADLHNALLWGAVTRGGEKWTALPREIVFYANQPASVIFEIFQPHALAKPRWLNIILRTIRPESLTLTFIPGLVILFAGVLKKWPISGFQGISAWIGAILLQVSMNILNEVEDHLRIANLPSMFRESGVLQKGWINARDLKRIGYTTLILGSFFGLPAVLLNPNILLALGLFGALGVIAYSSKPFGMKYNLFGDFLVFFLVGPCISVGLSQALFGQFDLTILSLGLVFGFLGWGVIHTIHLQSYNFDETHQIKTLAVQLGFKFARHFLLMIYVGLFLSLMLAIVTQVLPLVILIPFVLGVPCVLKLVQRVYKASGPISPLLATIRSEAVRIHFLLGLLLFIGFLLEVLL